MELKRIAELNESFIVKSGNTNIVLTIFNIYTDDLQSKEVLKLQEALKFNLILIKTNHKTFFQKKQYLKLLGGKLLNILSRVKDKYDVAKIAILNHFEPTIFFPVKKIIIAIKSINRKDEAFKLEKCFNDDTSIVRFNDLEFYNSFINDFILKISKRLKIDSIIYSVYINKKEIKEIKEKIISRLVNCLTN